MIKKIILNSVENGNSLMAAGYATNIKPGPESATSAICLPLVFAMKPSTEKTLYI